MPHTILEVKIGGQMWELGARGGQGLSPREVRCGALLPLLWHGSEGSG